MSSDQRAPQSKRHAAPPRKFSTGRSRHRHESCLIGAAERSPHRLMSSSGAILSASAQPWVCTSSIAALESFLVMVRPRYRSDRTQDLAELAARFSKFELDDPL